MALGTMMEITRAMNDMVLTLQSGGFGPGLPDTSLHVAINHKCMQVICTGYRCLFGKVMPCQKRPEALHRNHITDVLIIQERTKRVLRISCNSYR